MNSISTKRKVLFVLFLVLTVVWMTVIYRLSDSTADESQKHSRGISEKVALTIEPSYEIPEKYKEGDFFYHVVTAVRKSAHVTAYAILGVLVYFCVSSPYAFPKKHLAPMIVSVPVCVLYAISDEIHQNFIEGRCGRMSDVMLDSLGIAIGTLVAICFTLLYKRIHERKNNNE